MKVSLKLSGGVIRNISLIDKQTDRVLLLIERSQPGIKHCLIAKDPEGIRVYKILRTAPGKSYRNHQLLEVIRQDLWDNYKIEFIPLAWGNPTYADYCASQWLSLNNGLIMDVNGIVGSYFANILDSKGVKDPDLTELQNYVVEMNEF